MKVALAVWNGRISPVFDVARTLLVVDVNRNEEVGRCTQELAEQPAEQRSDVLLRRGIDVLICGAITSTLLGRLEAGGMRVLPRIRGEADEVLRAFLEGRLSESDLFHPHSAVERDLHG